MPSSSETGFLAEFANPGTLGPIGRVDFEKELRELCDRYGLIMRTVTWFDAVLMEKVDRKLARIQRTKAQA